MDFLWFWCNPNTPIQPSSHSSYILHLYFFIFFSGKHAWCWQVHSKNIPDKKSRNKTINTIFKLTALRFRIIWSNKLHNEWWNIHRMQLHLGISDWKCSIIYTFCRSFKTICKMNFGSVQLILVPISVKIWIQMC